MTGFMRPSTSLTAAILATLTLAIAQRFLADGASVAYASRTPTTPGDDRARFLPVDLTEPSRGGEVVGEAGVERLTMMPGGMSLVENPYAAGAQDYRRDEEDD